jgi:aryl-alcohol dehydrogenase-like predicted oxidoreductase
MSLKAPCSLARQMRCSYWKDGVFSFSLVTNLEKFMQKRRIGRSELQVAPLMFGGNVFGWTADEATSFSILDAFVDAGLDFIDTADVYSAWVPGNQGGESETILGKWFRQSGKRDKIVLATKVSKHPQRKGLSAANIQAAVEDSLRRLQTDYIDVYFSHDDDAETPLAEHSARTRS